ncbi:MAG: enoyl-CoA hydratase/isomerase family protein [Ardenticatenaceae bacterium]|nr:enoyl-CoA hydratase/isomerase family protein [Ardenticatenaceae bacterium]
MNEELIFSVADNVAVIRVNRPGARNALNWAAQEGFARAVTAVSADPTLRALIITGSGTQSFVAGGDLKELNNHADAESAQRLYKVMNEALQQLTMLPIPVIGAVESQYATHRFALLTRRDHRHRRAQAAVWPELLFDGRAGADPHSGVATGSGRKR